MSRDLEREYRAFVDSEVPDLWARIESGLEEKKPAADTLADTLMKDTRDRKMNYKVWAGLAAACVCAALVVPALVRNTGMKGGSNSAPAPVADTAPQAAEAYERAADNAGKEAALCEEVAEATADSGMGAAGGIQELYRFHAAVEILEVDVSMDSGVLYIAKVLSSDQSGIEPDSEIQIFDPLAASEGTELMETDQTYDLVLSGIRSEDPEQGEKYLLVDK